MAMTILEVTCEDGGISFLNILEERKQNMDKICTIILTTNFVVSADKAGEVFDALLDDDEILKKWQEGISFLAQKYQTDIVVKGTKIDLE